MAVRRIKGPASGLQSFLCDTGLGKTVEMLALILLNRNHTRHKEPRYRSDTTAAQVQPSSATLLVCPPAIIEQWRDEIRRHAPDLRVYRYDGIRSKDMRGREAADVATDYDIVLTTFAILGKEANISRKPFVRNTRQVARNQGEPTYQRSILVCIDWYRVIIDEARAYKPRMMDAR